MKKIFILIILLFICFPLFVKAEESKQRIYLIEVFYENGGVSLGEISTKMGYSPSPETVLKEIPYRIKIISFTGEILEEQMFSLSPYVYYDPPREGEDSSLPTGKTELDKTDTLAILPYHKDGKWIELSDANGNFIEKKDIGYLARVCGDGVCQDHESFENCSQDCDAIALDDYCNFDEYDNDPDCIGKEIVNSKDESGVVSEKTIVTAESNFLKYIFLGIIGIILIIFFVIMYFVIVKRNKNLE